MVPVDNGINDDLNRVGVSQEVDDFHGVLDDPRRHQLLSVVSPVHHERVREPLDDGALSLPESLHRVSSSCVGDEGSVFSCLYSNVVNKTYICDLQHIKNHKTIVTYNTSNEKNLFIQTKAIPLKLL